MRTPSHHRTVLLGIAASVSALVAATAYVQLQATQSWQAMVALGDDLRDQYLTEPQARRPLWGEASDENAFEHYSRAAALIKPIEFKQLVSKMHSKNDAEVALLCTDLRAAWQPGLTAMQSGARSLRALDPSLTSSDERVFTLLAYRSVCNAAVLETRILRHEGDLADSVQLTLDSMMMASDIFHSGVIINQMIGIALLEIAMDPWSDEALAQLDEHTAATFATGLARLDERMPTRMLTRCETMWMTEMLQKGPGQGDWSDLAAWRYGFSQRWMMAEAVLITAHNFERLAQVPDSDWATRKALFDQITAEVLATNNPVAHCMFPNLVHAELSIRQTIGNLRLLRMALDMHRGVVSEPLADPFGPGTLQVEKTGNHLLIKSIGNAGLRKLERRVAR